MGHHNDNNENGPLADKANLILSKATLSNWPNLLCWLYVGFLYVCHALSIMPESIVYLGGMRPWLWLVQQDVAYIAEGTLTQVRIGGGGGGQSDLRVGGERETDYSIPTYTQSGIPTELSSTIGDAIVVLCFSLLLFLERK